MPGQVEGEVRPIHPHVHQLVRHRRDPLQPALHAALGAHHAHVFPHDLLELLAQGQDQIRLARQRVHCAFHLSRQDIFIRIAQGTHGAEIRAHRIASDPAINGGIGHPIAAQSV